MSNKQKPHVEVSERLHKRLTMAEAITRKMEAMLHHEQPCSIEAMQEFCWCLIAQREYIVEARELAHEVTKRLFFLDNPDQCKATFGEDAKPTSQTQPN